MSSHPDLSIRLFGVDFRAGIQSVKLGDGRVNAFPTPIVVLDGASQPLNLRSNGGFGLHDFHEHVYVEKETEEEYEYEFIIKIKRKEMDL